MIRVFLTFCSVKSCTRNNKVYEKNAIRKTTPNLLNFVSKLDKTSSNPGKNTGIVKAPLAFTPGWLES